MNNFHINLLRKDEITSPSPLNAGSLKRIGLPLIPILIAAMIAFGYLTIIQRQQEFENVTQRNKILKTEKQLHEEAAVRSDMLRAGVKEMMIWRELQPPTSEIITLLIEAVPETMQIVSFDIGKESSVNVRNRTPGEIARSYRFVMNCRAAPQCNAKDIRDFVEKLETSHLIATAREFNYSEKRTADGSPDIRSFQVECITSERSVK